MKMSTSPLITALAGSGVTWLGLAAAAAGWRWTSQTHNGPAWDHAWLYTNMTLAMCLFVIFPAICPIGSSTTIQMRQRDLIAHGLALLLAAVPILTLAAWFNHIAISAAIDALFVQAAFAIFTLGVSTRIASPDNETGLYWHAATVGLFLLPPGIELIQASTFPWLTGGLWSHWITVFPVSMIATASEHPGRASDVHWIACVYAAIGLVMFFRPLAAHKSAGSRGSVN